MDNSALAVWGAILALAALLLGGAWLGARSLAAAAAPGGVTAAAADDAGPYSGYLAPESVCPGAADLGAPVEAQQQTQLCLVNYARAAAGAPAVQTSETLMRSAALKAEDIVRCREFAHETCGAPVRQRFADAGYLAADVETRFGENLALGSGAAGSPRAALLAWLESDAHRANLLKSEWAEQGIALVYVRNFRGVADTRIWVSHFGRRG